eukprot:31018-Pelagococcus_subviridis.AAC.1
MASGISAREIAPARALARASRVRPVPVRAALRRREIAPPRAAAAVRVLSQHAVRLRDSDEGLVAAPLLVRMRAQRRASKRSLELVHALDDAMRRRAVAVRVEAELEARGADVERALAGAAARGRDEQERGEEDPRRARHRV